jgi:hypothetical protein
MSYLNKITSLKNITLDDKKALLEKATFADVFDLLSKYPIVTRKLLLVSQILPTVSDTKSPDYGSYMYTYITNKAAKLVRQHAESKNWKVTYLEGDNATKNKIINTIKTEKPDCFMWYGHSNSSTLYGQNNGKLEMTISTSNVNNFSGRSVSTVGCLSASILGPKAITTKTLAYLGYISYHTVWAGSLTLENDCIESSNAANYALLEGETYKVAYDIGWKAYDDKWKKWTKLKTVNPKDGPLIAASFLDNRDRLKRLGNPQVVARPIGILINT